MKKHLPNFIIGAGILLVLAVGVYSASSYPWRALLVSWGWLEPVEPPDPAPLDATLLTTPTEDLSDPPGVAQLPGNPDSASEDTDLAITSLGIIKIPKIQLSQNIVEGSDSELYHAVGHVTGTALPGGSGNCVLAGHRNYIPMRPFRYLDLVEEGDTITLSTPHDQFTYEVFRIFEAEPGDVWILQPQEEEEALLTLITCTPVLTMENRLIVQARLTEIIRNTD